jgi:hypothetical protein
LGINEVEKLVRISRNREWKSALKRDSNIIFGVCTPFLFFYNEMQ